MNDIIKKIKRDCFEAMAPAWIVSTLQEIAVGLISVWMTTFVADFTDAILQFDKTIVTNMIWKIVFCILISVLFIPFVSFICNMLMITRALKHDRNVLGRFLEKKYDSAMKIEVGDAQFRLENDPNNYRLEWMEWMTQFFSMTVILIYLMYSSFRLNVQYTLITIAISAIRFVLPVCVRKISAKYYKEQQDYATDLRKSETDITSQPHYTVMLGIEQGMLHKINNKFLAYYNNTGKKGVRFSSFTSFISSLIDNFSSLLIIVVGAVFVSRNHVSAGTVMAMLGFSSIYDRLINSAAYIIKERLIIKALVERISVLYSDAEALEGKNVNKFEKISAVDLSYKYTDTDVFEPVNFNICSGDKVAICGENGSGKSTLLNILCGLNCNYSGQIIINQREMSELSIVNWRNQISFATQEPFLFPGTVLDNLTFGGLASEEAAMHALDEMGIAYLAEREISVNQDSLSVGEKQRISLSRAILKNTPIVFLDEPSNHLDSDSVQIIMDFIRCSAKTVVYISHSDKMTKLATRVIRLKKNAPSGINV